MGLVPFKEEDIELSHVFWHSKKQRYVVNTGREPIRGLSPEPDGTLMLIWDLLASVVYKPPGLWSFVKAAQTMT